MHAGSGPRQHPGSGSHPCSQASPSSMTMRPSPEVPASLPSSCRVSRGDAHVSPINGSCRSSRIRSGGPLSCPIFFPHQISTTRGQDALAGQRCVTSSSPRRSRPHEALGWRGGWLPRGKPRGAEIPSKCLHPPFRAEASLEAQMVRICLQCWRPGFHPWVWKILWRREWAGTHSSILVWMFPWTEEPGRL